MELVQKGVCVSNILVLLFAQHHNAEHSFNFDVNLDCWSLQSVRLAWLFQLYHYFTGLLVSEF